MINGDELVYQQFNILKTEGHSIIGYVIMPNHIHFIADYSVPAASPAGK